MTDNYKKIAQGNLEQLYKNLPADLAEKLPGKRDGDQFIFSAFGETCIIELGGITLGKEDHSSVFDILITLYALNACSDICILKPFKAFKEFPDSNPYVGAFTTHTENILVPYVMKIEASLGKIIEKMSGETASSETGGDFAFTVYPLPKIALTYIFYEADDDFPASVTCLFSNNANRFLPIDGLADVGEYTSKKIIKMIGS